MEKSHVHPHDELLPLLLLLIPHRNLYTGRLIFPSLNVRPIPQRCLIVVVLFYIFFFFFFFFFFLAVASFYDGLLSSWLMSLQCCAVPCRAVQRSAAQRSVEILFIDVCPISLPPFFKVKEKKKKKKTDRPLLVHARFIFFACALGLDFFVVDQKKMLTRLWLAAPFFFLSC